MPLPWCKFHLATRSLTSLPDVSSSVHTNLCACSDLSGYSIAKRNDHQSSPLLFLLLHFSFSSVSSSVISLQRQNCFIELKQLYLCHFGTIWAGVQVMLHLGATSQLEFYLTNAIYIISCIWLKRRVCAPSCFA